MRETEQAELAAAKARDAIRRSRRSNRTSGGGGGGGSRSNGGRQRSESAASNGSHGATAAARTGGGSGASAASSGVGVAGGVTRGRGRGGAGYADATRGASAGHSSRPSGRRNGKLACTHVCRMHPPTHQIRLCDAPYSWRQWWQVKCTPSTPCFSTRTQTASCSRLERCRHVPQPLVIRSRHGHPLCFVDSFQT